MMRLIKEVCRYCEENIYLGQVITECDKCKYIIHTKCFKKSAFQTINSKQYCSTCTSDIEVIYNPLNHCADHSLGVTIITVIITLRLVIVLRSEDLTKISDILKNCTRYNTINNFNCLINQTVLKNENFSILFQNIDGNKTNFDAFAVNESQLKHKFSVVGLAETNFEPCNKDLFGLNDNTSDYQDINSSKFKGTGVALYIHNSLKATQNTALCKTTPDFESLFVTAIMGSKKVP